MKKVQSLPVINSTRNLKLKWKSSNIFNISSITTEKRKQISINCALLKNKKLSAKHIKSVNIQNMSIEKKILEKKKNLKIIKINIYL